MTCKSWKIDVLFIFSQKVMFYLFCWLNASLSCLSCN